LVDLFCCFIQVFSVGTPFYISGEEDTFHGQNYDACFIMNGVVFKEYIPECAYRCYYSRQAARQQAYLDYPLPIAPAPTETVVNVWEGNQSRIDHFLSLAASLYLRMASLISSKDALALRKKSYSDLILSSKITLEPRPSGFIIVPRSYSMVNPVMRDIVFLDVNVRKSSMEFSSIFLYDRIRE